jgi:hypothetical protein
MNFTRQTWEDQTEQNFKQPNRLTAWLRRQSKPAGFVAYGSIAAFTIWPLVQVVTAAAAAGQLLPLSVIMTLGAVLSNLGSNLLAGQLQTWYENARQGDAPTEEDVLDWLTENAPRQSDLKAEIDKVLEELQAIPHAQAALPAAEWTALARQLQEEMQRLGNLPRFQAQLEGSGNIIQGENIRFAQKRSAIVEGDVGENVITGDNNSVTTIRQIYLNAPGKAAVDEAGFNQAIDRYLAWVAQRYGRLNLRGVEQREQKALTLTLDDIYVSLAAVVTPERKAGRGMDGLKLKGGAEPLDLDPELNAEEWLIERSVEERAIERSAEEWAIERGDGRLEPVDMSRLLPLCQRLVITGGPGCGKTTYLHLIAASIAQAIRRNQPKSIATHLGLSDPLPLPIVVALSEFNQYRRRHSQADDPHRGTLIAFISHSLIRQQAAIGLPRDFFERLLVEGKSCLLLLDGLDEVANERERVLVSRAVENLAYNEGVRQMVLTSRSRAYQGEAVLPETFRLAAVQPMSPEQTAALAERWCHAVYDATRASQEAESLQRAIAALEAVRKRRGESRLADTPLMVTIIAIVHYNQRRLPEQRAELYEKCVEVLLTEGHHGASEATYELADWGGFLPEKRGLLAYLAYQMMRAGAQAGRIVRQFQIERWLRPRLVSRYGEAGRNRT